MKSMRRWGLPLLAVLALAGCDMDLTDPNNPTEELAVTTPMGIRQVAIGLQATYSNQLVDPVYTVGLVTDELGAAEATFESFQKADAGEEITGSDGPSTNAWSGMYSVIRVADVLIENADNVGFGDAYVSGLLAVAKFYKGLAFGQLAQIYPAAPIDVGPDNPSPVFADRDQVLAEALALLQEARDHLQSAPPPPEFADQVLADAFDLENSVNAMIARFALMDEDYTLALSAANAVDLAVLSEFEFSTSDSNPLWGMWYASGNAFQLRTPDAWRAGAEAGDQRVDYWTMEADIAGAVQPLDEVARYMDQSDTYPVYLPDEMRLIRAEVYARQGGGDALAELNAVRTPCSSPLDEPVACLPALTPADVATQQEMLDAILMERKYELYLQAVRWSDLLRFGEPVKYTVMPVPLTECDRNSNAPGQYCPN